MFQVGPFYSEMMYEVLEYNGKDKNVDADTLRNILYGSKLTLSCYANMTERRELGFQIPNKFDKNWVHTIKPEPV